MYLLSQLRCFATETNQTLIHFHTVDHFGICLRSNIEEVSQKGLANILLMLLALSCKISYGIFLIQQLLIFLKDSLCIGMPVIIRNNDTIELCITKGQEEVVAG